MPELPEVETVRASLAGSIVGQRIEDVVLRRKDLRIPFPKDFTKNLTGKTILEIERRAKYLLIHLSGGDTMIAHLGMSGHFSVVARVPKKFQMHDHVIITLADGRVVIYHDPRRFGLMTLEKTKNLSAHPLLSNLGPEPFSKEFNAAYLKQELLRRKAPIKPVLMDQQLVVGVGNIYASEALFLAGIDPRKPASEGASKAKLLVESIRRVLADAIESGGSSLRDFVHISGETGYFQHRFNVYEREHENCFKCSTTIQSIRQAGRSTYFCCGCQK